jgi:hypothetical protein
MYNSLKFKRKVRPLCKISLLTLTFLSMASAAIAKPSNWSYKIGDFLQLDFKGCTKTASGDDVICVGNFRSRSGERQISIGPGYDNYKNISITDSRGKVTNADEVRIGDNWSCRVGTNCGTWNSGIGNMVFVEGIDYKTLFIFKDVSLPSTKLPLFYLSFDRNEIKVRNIAVSTSRSSLAAPQQSLTTNVDSELDDAARAVDRLNQQRSASALSFERARQAEATAQKMREAGFNSPQVIPSTPSSSSGNWFEETLKQGLLDLIGKPR